MIFINTNISFKYYEIIIYPYDFNEILLKNTRKWDIPQCKQLKLISVRNK